jgi:S-DNA-T family DNA segregation ATPase FtsK/SpoIIIE
VDTSKPYRVQGIFLSDKEIEAIVRHWISQSGPDLPELVVTNNTNHTPDITSESSTDSLYERAVELAESQRTLSVSLLQRRLRIGYPRAARLMDELEDTGIVGQGEPGKPRPVL